MKKMRSSTLREQAAEWVILLDDENCSAEKKAEFDAWLSAAPAHRAAFEQASRLWRNLDDVVLPRALPGERSAGPLVAGKPRMPHPVRYRMWAGAACAFLATVAVFHQDLEILLRADVRTAYGETRQFTLEDGTRVHLNTGSAIAFHATPARREARVLAGEVAFDIARDKRPFHVRAGEGDITDIGTVFQVRLARDDSVDVTVSEGEVRVAHGSAGTSLLRGQRVAYSPRSGLEKVGTVDIDSATAWQRGRLVFIDQPLGHVVAELNRYTPGHIRLANDALAGLKVSGVYKTEDPFAALHAIEGSLGLRSLRVGSYALVLARNAEH